jgi:hypothetical protein
MPTRNCAERNHLNKHVMSEPDEFYQDDTFRYWQHRIERRDPLGTMVIQGHALLEEELNAFIAKAFKTPKAVDRFSFGQKVQLVKAFYSPDERLFKVSLLRINAAGRSGSRISTIAVVPALR